MEMRSRRGTWLSLFALAIIAAAPACFPDPDADFTDYQERIKGYVPPTPTNTGGTSGTSTSSSSGGPIEAGPPPVEVTEATYFASCLSELAGGNVKKTFSFWVTAKYTPNQDTTTGGTLSLSLEALKLESGLPPANISRADIVSKLPDIVGTANGSGSFVAATAGGSASFAGAANPISGSDVQISNAGLKGVYVPAGFCARLFGHVDKPEAASRDLAEGKNQCLFTPIKEGEAAPTGRVASSYADTNCPL